MTETKTFPTEEVLSTITGVLITPDVGAIYRVLNWMTGEDVYTHQIPRISREARAAMHAHRPDLAATADEAKAITPLNWQHWRDTWVKRYGPTIDVVRMTIDQHERIDPLSELAEKVPPDRLLVIKA